MKRNTMLKIVNPVLAVLFINQILTGVFGGSLSGEAFEILHEDAGFVLAAVATLHLILNWSWVKANFFKRTPGAKA
ncbi:MAG: hypothetical protein WCG03_08775 [Kiritimatiellales bacterium]